MKYIEVEPFPQCLASLPARGVWIEMFPNDDFIEAFESLPARGVWIEINR